MYQVYKITCSANSKVYIGYTSKGIDARFKSHIENARWHRKTALYNAIRFYGEHAFSIELLEEIPSHEDACASEVRHIAEMRSVIPNGYNMTTGGDGVPITAELIAQASAKKRGKFTEKQAAAAERRRGVPLTPEHRAKLSLARKGKPKSEDWKRKISESNKRSLEARRQKEAELQEGCRPEEYWTPERRMAKSAMVKAQWTEERKRAVSERARQRRLLKATGPQEPFGNQNQSAERMMRS